MALMFGAWFLLAYVHAVEKRSWWWLGLASVAGIGCGLVKVTTLFFFLMPGFLWTLWWFREDWCQPAPLRARAVVRRVIWCALAVALPSLASGLVGPLYRFDQGAFRRGKFSDFPPADRLQLWDGGQVFPRYLAPALGRAAPESHLDSGSGHLWGARAVFCPALVDDDRAPFESVRAGADDFPHPLRMA